MTWPAYCIVEAFPMLSQTEMGDSVSTNSQTLKCSDQRADTASTNPQSAVVSTKPQTHKISFVNHEVVITTKTW